MIAAGEKNQVKIPSTEKVMPIIKKSKKNPEKSGVILRRRVITSTSNPLQELILITYLLWRKIRGPINSETLFNGYKERSQSEAFNRIFFDIFVLNIDGEIDRRKVHLNLGNFCVRINF